MNKKKKPTKAKAANKPSKKAFTQKQIFVKMIEDFEIRVNEKLDAFRQAVNGMAERLQRNMQLLDQGLHTAEAHVIIMRRVIDDGLNGVIVTKEVPVTMREVKDGVDTTVETKGRNVDWAHYTSWFMQERAKAQAAKEAAIKAAKEAAEKAHEEKAGQQDGQPTAEVIPLRPDGPKVPGEQEVVAEIVAKKEEPPAPPKDDGIPEGAAVFGGD